MISIILECKKLIYMKKYLHPPSNGNGSSQSNIHMPQLTSIAQANDEYFMAALHSFSVKICVYDKSIKEKTLQS